MKQKSILPEFEDIKIQLTKKVSQRIAPSEDFYIVEIWGFKTQQLHIVYFFGVIDTSLQSFLIPNS